MWFGWTEAGICAAIIILVVLTILFAGRSKIGFIVLVVLISLLFLYLCFDIWRLYRHSHGKSLI